jgi:DNA helicase-2/ATP-dependent DNA helicase PcrA
MAKILGREAPSLNKVFSELPTNIPFNINDENYPADPKDAKRGSAASQEYYDGQHKRQRTYSSQNTLHGPSDEAPWRKDYSTTMEESTRFTVAATTLPGFTTAGAHCTAMAVRGNMGSRSGHGDGRGRPMGRGRGRQLPASRSLLGSGRGQVTDSQTGGSKPLPTGQQELPWKRTDPGQVQMGFNRPLDQASIIEATRRGLQDVRRRVQARTNQQQQQQDSDGLKTAGSSYPGFSSPPKGEAAADKGDQENRDSEPRGRPTSCFHATTMTSIKGPASGAIRRLPGLNRAGMPSMAPLDKLRRPFQPLRVARGGNGNDPVQRDVQRN